MNIILIGYRCSGKTLISKELAIVQNKDRVSTDELIERKVGPISEFVKKNGWEEFRKIEEEIATNISQSNIIVDTGGGVIENENIMNHLKKNSKIIWLKCTIEKTKELLQGDKTRPSLTNNSNVEEVEEIYNKRKPLYKKYADHTIDTTDWNIESFIAEITRLVK